jgi:uncharacterized protein Yka (UPF0111/DUF47 family)
VRPLQQHMAKVVECVCELEALFDALLADDWAQRDFVRKLS